MLSKQEWHVIEDGGPFAVEAVEKIVSKFHVVLKEEHEAIDWLLARLATLDRSFFPSQSPIWPAVERGAALLREMETQERP